MDLGPTLQKYILNIRGPQIEFLRRVIEVVKSTAISVLCLELGILPIWFEIEKRQLLSLKEFWIGMMMPLIKWLTMKW